MTGLRTGLGLSAAALLNYLAWLAWDRERDVAPDGAVSGPYQAWQVVGLVVVLGVLGWLAGRSRNPVIGTVGVAGTTWLCWTADAAVSDDSGLWAVGAALLLPAVFAGVGLVAFVATRLRKRAATG